jgi:hypothetical protein
MPKLISISTDSTGRFVAVDEDGSVWRGETKRDRHSGAEYVFWRRLPSEFQETEIIT